MGGEQGGRGHAWRMRAKLPDMTGPSSGSIPHRVDDPGAARLLMDETSRSVFGCVLGTDRSVREAADLLDRDLDAVLYRVKRLHAAGLLEVVAVVPRAGRAVRRYRAPHEAWFVPFEVLPYADLEEAFNALHVRTAARAARAAARWLVRSPWAGYLVERGEDGQVWMRGTGACSQLSTWPMRMSMGISRKTGPGMPETACRTASSMYSGMRSVW